MHRRLARRAGGDRGAVILEFALTVPLLFAMMFTLADFSLAEVGNSAGANAARDGARVGIINFANADQTTSANYALIKAAVNKRLAGLVQANPTVTVSCLQSDGVTATTHGCDPTYVSIGSDLIKVQVQWTQVTALNLVSSRTRTDAAVMRIVGSAPTSADAGGGSSGGTTSCVLSNAAVSPSTVNSSGGTLSSSLVFSVSVNDTGACGIPLITLPSQSGLAYSVNMTETGLTTQFTYTYPPTDGTSVTQAWTAAGYTAQIQQQAGTATTSVPFTVTSNPTSCVFGTATPNFVSVQLQNKNSHSVKNNTSNVIKLPVNDRTLCATPTAQVTGVSSPLNTAQNMVWDSSQNAYTLTISSSTNNTPWNSGSGLLVLSGPGGSSTTLQITVA